MFGLDGATFDLMLPWIAEGHLPCLAKLIDGGAHSRLESTIPPITPCAWSSFMTGKNPGKHGLFDFIEPLPGTQGGFRFTNASSRQAESLWAYLSRLGRRVGVMNVPMTYPPEQVNGYLISGLDTPNDRSRYSYPDTLREELREQSIDYRIDIQHLGNMRSDRRRDHWLKQFHAVEATRTRALKYLRKAYPSDFTMLVYTATDQVQHHFWHYMDPKHDKYDARGAERYKHAIRDVYIHLDRLIASVLEDEDDDTIVMLMSDHGFGPTSNVRLRLNQALAQRGLLSFEPEASSGRLLRTAAGLVDRLLRSTLSNGAKRALASLMPRLRVWMENLDEARIDWTRTAVYANEAWRATPSVWLNRQAGAATATAEDKEALLRAAEDVLKSLTDPSTGKPVVSNVFRTADVYHGPFVSCAPELIPSWWEDGFLLEQSVPGGSAASVVELSQTPIEGGVEFAGSHRLDGVFAMAGGPVRAGFSFAGARIIDVAPTVLYLMGLPIPEDMDGRPLIEAMHPEFVAERAGGDQPQAVGAAAPAAPQTVFSAEEAQLIEERLKAMGYL